MSSILLLEDDPQLAKSLVRFLTRHGYRVEWVKTGEEAIDATFDRSFSLYLLDINVPQLNGIDVLTQLRDTDDHTPAIIISALTDVASVSQGFTAGADDYLKKPFDPDELLVRIRAKTNRLIRRTVFGDVEIDRQNGTVYKAGRLHPVGDVQRALLLELVRHHPNPAPKHLLLETLEKPTDLALRVNISRLKKELGVTIKAVRGVGYQII